ncbi:MAG: hypothetical protein ACI4TM_06725 [Candidatus Cryptobacteroides sp.]
MVDISTIGEGDRLCWRGKCGDVFSEVRRSVNGELAAFTDETHCIPLKCLAGSASLRVVDSPDVPVQKAVPTYTVDDAPVLF